MGYVSAQKLVCEYRQAKHQKLKDDVERFLKQGGEIQQFKQGEASHDPAQKRRMSMSRGMFTRREK